MTLNLLNLICFTHTHFLQYTCVSCFVQNYNKHTKIAMVFFVLTQLNERQYPVSQKEVQVHGTLTLQLKCVHDPVNYISIDIVYSHDWLQWNKNWRRKIQFKAFGQRPFLMYTIIRTINEYFFSLYLKYTIIMNKKYW